MESPLFVKSKQFALDIIKVCNKVKAEKRESVLTNQLIRSGTSIGANIREAFYGHGKNDFIAKLQIALKECSESEYWIELLIESGYYEDKTILDRCIELKKILISSINTAKKNNKWMHHYCPDLPEKHFRRSAFQFCISVYKFILFSIFCFIVVWAYANVFFEDVIKMWVSCVADSGGNVVYFWILFCKKLFCFLNSELG